MKFLFKDEALFTRFDDKLASSREHILLNFSRLETQIEQCISINRIEQNLNRKRNQFLKQIEQTQLSLFKKLNEFPRQAKNELVKETTYIRHVYSQADSECSLKFNLVKACLFYTNEFNILKKLTYYELHRPVQSIRMPENYQNILNVYSVSLNTYFIYDHNSKELKLLDASYNKLKSIPVKNNYHCIQYDVSQSRIVCNFSNPLNNRTYACVLDYSLNLIKTRLVSSREITMIHVGQNYIYYTCPVTMKYIILDMDLNHKDTISFELIGFIYSIVDDHILKYYLNKELKILSRKNFSLVRSIQINNGGSGATSFEDKTESERKKNFKVVNLFFDDKSNIYIISKSLHATERVYFFECFNLNGDLLRKQMLNDTYEHTFFKVFDEKIYYFDEQRLISVY